MEQNDVTVFRQAIMACGDPAEIARKVKLAFKKMSGEMALVCFAKVMTADLPHPVKVAVWDAVRYSHIWWGVDEVLKGRVMENPIVQQAFADAVPMRRWAVEHRWSGWKGVAMTLDPLVAFRAPVGETEPYRILFLLTHFSDVDASDALKDIPESDELAREIASYSDWRGNNLLWYLTYRDDQNAQGGFACPCIERELLRLGVDPNRRNGIGLCWNDVRRHFVRSEA